MEEGKYSFQWRKFLILVVLNMLIASKILAANNCTESSGVLNCTIDRGEETFNNINIIQSIESTGGKLEISNGQNMIYLGIKDNTGGKIEVNGGDVYIEQLQTLYFGNDGEYVKQENKEINVKNGKFTSNHIINNVSTYNNGFTEISKLNISGGTTNIGSIINGDISRGNNRGYGSEVNISNGNFLINQIDNYAKVNISGGNGSININNYTSSQFECANVSECGGVVKISGGETTANINNNGKINISGGTNVAVNNTNNININGGENTFTSINSNSGEIKISNGTNTFGFKDSANSANSKDFKNYSNLIVSGGTNKGIITNNGDFSISGGNNNFTIINNTKNLEVSSNVELKSFINSGNTALKAGEFKISSVAANEVQIFVNEALGIFSLDGNVKLTSEANMLNNGKMELKSGNLTIQNKTLTNQDSRSIINLDGANLDIKTLENLQGTFNANSGNLKAENIDNKGIFNANGGTISVDYFSNNGGSIVVREDSQINKKDGSTKGTINNNVLSEAIKDSNRCKIYNQQDSTKCDEYETIGSRGITSTITLESKTLTADIKNDSKTFNDIVDLLKCNQYDSKGMCVEYAKITQTFSSTIQSKGNSKIAGNVENKGNVVTLNGSIFTIQGNFKNYGADSTGGGNIGGNITALKDSTLTISNFDWGNGTINYINGNNGIITLNNITNILQDTTSPSDNTKNSNINLNFSTKPMQTNIAYEIFNVTGTATDLESKKDNINVTDNLVIKKEYLDITRKYENSKFSVTYSYKDSALKQNLENILQEEAKNTLQNQGTLDMLDELKAIKGENMLSQIISSPSQISNELKNINSNIAKANRASLQTSLILASNLSNLNRLNKATTTNFYAQASKRQNLQIRTISSDLPKNLNEDSIDESYLGEDFNESIFRNMVKIYEQEFDYLNNLYASIFGIFGKFDNSTLASFGFIVGYDRKIMDNFLLGGSVSYGMLNSTNLSNNLLAGLYSRIYLQNSEIDISANFNLGINESEGYFLGKSRARFLSYGFNLSANYGYLANLLENHFFKPSIGLNVYYNLTPKYQSIGNIAQNIASQSSVEISLDIGVEYRFYVDESYLFAKVSFEQFLLNNSNSIQMSFVGSANRFEIAKYGGNKNYIYILLGGDFGLIENTLNLNANIGFKSALSKSRIYNFKKG
ncbi:MAG: autotransporter outer membrane beta-barrel domain-containing protein [Helicobacteraceae bacterium]|nr:autotransporter outer membrane beta-barrel domain-containing protein [Helicobacteraceae bacterium]